MENNNYTERLYDLIEQYDFNELTEENKQFVLTHSTKKEYEEMRLTLSLTRNSMDNEPDFSVADMKPEFRNHQKSFFVKVMTYPVSLYKVAAVVLLIPGIMYLFAKMDKPQNDINLSSVDTVYLKQKDVVEVVVKDTVEIIREKIIYRDNNPGNYTKDTYVSMPYLTAPARNCAIEVCPDDLHQFAQPSGKGSIANDTIYEYFISNIY